MNGSLPKRHHIVPRFLLNNFADGTGKIWVHRWGKLNVHHESVHRAFTQKHLYRSADWARPPGAKPPQHNLATEYTLAKLEQQAAPIISTIIDTARTLSAKSIALTEGDARVLKCFFYAMIRRSPETGEDLRAKTSNHEFYHSTLRIIAEQNEGFPRSLMDFSESDCEALQSRLKELRHKVWTSFVDASHPSMQADVLKFCNDTGINIYVVRDGSEFIIGSRGVTWVHVPGIQSSSLMSCLPLSYDVAISPSSESGKLALIDVTNAPQSMVDAHNMSASQESQTIGGCSRSVVAGLRNDRLDEAGPTRREFGF